ncbi:hypothetical protein ES703_71305 [subsurface metagenome]
MTSRFDIEEAAAFYHEFEGEGPSHEEITDIDDYDYVQVYRKMPVTFGFEIEQKTADIPGNLRIAYPFHHDLSGPCETALPPSTYPGRALRAFVEECAAENRTWDWKSQFQWRSPHRGQIMAGCGSHIHFRPRFEDVDMVRERDPMIPWSCAYNTLVESVVFLLPMFCWGADGVFRFRDSALDIWAKFTGRRLSPEYIRRKFLNDWYDGHPYDQVAFNRKPYDTRHPPKHCAGRVHGEPPITEPSRKPLTLELRLNETHPAISYELGILLNRIIRKCFDRGFISPKLNRRTRANTFDEIEGRTKRSVNMQNNLYDELHMVQDIEFQRGREIPLLQTKYDTYLDLFDDILKKYGHSYPPMARVCRLFLARGEPWKNPNAIWKTFYPLKEFKWDEEDIPSQ